MKSASDTTDLSQSHTLGKLAVFLENEHREEEFVGKIREGGYCAGFTALYLYALWLQGQPVTDVTKPRDDLDWLVKTLTLLSNWDEKREFNEAEKNQIDRLTSHLEHFQNINDYQDIPQGELHLALEDTRYKDRRLQREFMLASCFDLAETGSVLKSIVQDERMVLISSHDHDVGVLKRGSQLYYIDPNNKKLEVLNSIEALANAIFASNEFKADKLSPLGFRVYSFDPGKVSYPSPADILKTLRTRTEIDYDKNYAAAVNELVIACDLGAVESVDYILSRNATEKFINYQISDGATALIAASRQGHRDIVQRLMDKGADVNIADNKGHTALMLAALHKRGDIAGKLLRHPKTDLTMTDKQGLDAWRIALKSGHRALAREIYAASAPIYLEHLTGAIRDASPVSASFFAEKDAAALRIFIEQIKTCKSWSQACLTVNDWIKGHKQHPFTEALCRRIKDDKVLERYFALESHNLNTGINMRLFTLHLSSRIENITKMSDRMESMAASPAVQPQK